MPGSIAEQRDSAPEQLHHFQLSSGRHLSYATYGCRLGRPVFFFHGFPGSRLEGALWHEAAVKLNVFLIVPDRPGIGFSSFQPGRQILDWPRDVLELATHLEINSFHVLAMAAGSPYALACVRKISSNKLLGAAIVSGAYPLTLGAEDMMLRPRVMLFIALWLTALMAIVVDLMVGRAARAKDPTPFETAMEQDHRTMSETDQAALQNKKFKADHMSAVRESMRSGSYGFAWDARLLGGDWGLRLEDIDGKRLTIWHGTLDNVQPLSMAEAAAKKIEGVKFKTMQEGHLSLAKTHAEVILGDLIK